MVIMIGPVNVSHYNIVQSEFVFLLWRQLYYLLSSGRTKDSTLYNTVQVILTVYCIPLFLRSEALRPSSLTRLFVSALVCN